MYLLFEVGGTNTKIGFSENGERIDYSEIFLTPKDFGSFIDTLKEKSEGKDIKAISGGMPVVFDKNKLIIASAHLPEWIGISAQSKLEEAFSVKITLDNETSVAALGEAIKGAGRNYSIVAFITVGTGVGSSRIVDGKIDKKTLGFESGHQIIVPEGESCSCGGKGHLEAYVGGYYIEKKYGQKAQDIKDEKIWDGITRNLAMGLYNMSVHWSPEIIILGGHVSQSINIEKLKKYLKEFSTIFPEIPEIKFNELGDQSGLYGALELLKW